MAGQSKLLLPYEYVSPVAKQAPRHSTSVNVEDELPQRTDALVRGLDLVLWHHGASDLVRSELGNQLHEYLDASTDETVWLKCAKHLLAYPLSKYLRNEPPAPPEKSFSPRGVLRAWMRQRLTVFSRKNTHLWYSWFQAKRSTLPASDSIVAKTYESHYATLSKPDDGDVQVIDEIFSDPTFRRLMDTLRKEMTEKLSSLGPFEDFSASGSACFEQTRGKGGQHAELLARAGLSSSEVFGSSELYSMRFDPVVYGRDTRYNVVTEVRVAPGVDEWRTLVAHAKSRDFSQPTKCTIQAVLEPMKVRVISKGEALPYYTCRPLQRALHSSMRKLDCFRLIGRPFSPTDMIDLMENAQLDDEWFSVDYSAATDGLSWRYSGRIFRFLIGNLPKEQFDRAMAVLGPHALHYPSGREVVYRGMQLNGQLMGSILSFPILCLANLGVYLRVTRESQKGWTDEERLRHVLVNGDDMVYAASPALWPEHIRVGNAVGLKMSVGKAYHHREYANINSTSIHYAIDRLDSSPYQIDYLNAGLFYGQHKVQERVDCREPKGLTEVMMESDRSCRVVRDEQQEWFNSYAAAHMGQDPAKGLAVNLNVLLAGTLPGKQGEVLGRFLTTHKEDLRKECAFVMKRRGHLDFRVRNLFLPISVGGMGVNAPLVGFPPRSWKYEINTTDKLLGGLMLSRQTAPKSFGLPLPGYALGELETEKSVPWVKLQSEKDEFAGFDVSAVGCKMHLRPKARILRSGFWLYGPNRCSLTS